MQRIAITCLLSLLSLVAGCADEESSTQPTPEPEPRACMPGETEQPDTSCRAAGIASDACAEGFAYDEQLGCVPQLPPPCATGTLAVPGDDSCRPVADCGAAPWGDIPTDATTQYVDASYGGGDSNGSEAKPWINVSEAVAAAAPGAVIAIAEGRYSEEVTISGKPLALWGRCPELVDLVGPAGGLGAVVVLTGASGSELHTVALSGGTHGFAMTGSTNVVLDRLWIHDNDGRGIVAEWAYGAASFSLQDSLVEANLRIGVFLSDSVASVDRSVVRDNRSDVDGAGGRGISAQAHPDDATPSTLTLTASVVEQSGELGVFVSGSDATIDGSVIRDSRPDANGLGGRGISADAYQGTRSTLLLTRSLIEQSAETAVHVNAADAVIDATVVRDALRGVGTQVGGTVALSGSLLDQTHELGIFLGAAQAEVSATLIRDSQVNSRGVGGRGINAQAGSALTLLGSRIERSHEAGVFVEGSGAAIERTLIVDTQPNAGEVFGDGVIAFSYSQPAEVVVSECLVQDSKRAGVAAFGAALSLANSRLSCQGFDMSTDDYEQQPATLTDLGGNRCGCPEATESCRASAANLEPPPALADTD